MRTERNLLDSTTVVLERPAELSALSPSLLKRVSPSARALFAGFPDSARQLAARAPSRALADALGRLAASSLCELEIHSSGYPRVHPAETFVRFGERPVLLSGGYARVPARCPPALAGALRLVGIVRMQYGFALGLVAPAQQIPLSKLAADFEAIYPGELSQLPMPADPRTFHAFYENSGAYVCADRAGATWKFSLTGGDYGPGPSVGDWLDAFFDKGPFGPAWVIGN